MAVTRSPSATGVLYALGAAALFGATTPLVKAYGDGIGAFATAALLYFGSLLASLPRSGAPPSARLRRVHIARIVAAATLGASIAPALFAWGLSRVSGGAGGLLLTSETAATVLLARLILREHIGRRALVAIGLIALGTVIVVGTRGRASASGAIAIVLATVAWALDNVITRPLADVDATAVVRWKSGIGAVLSLGAMTILEGRPAIAPMAAAALVFAGALGYGLSLRAYLAAQTRIGAARTGSVFAVAPFAAAIASAVAAWDAPPLALYVAAAPIALGVWLHATERHAHLHRHAPVVHEHRHVHDDGHHDHVHDPPFIGEHSHPHEHGAVEHEHPHDDEAHHDA